MSDCDQLSDETRRHLEGCLSRLAAGNAAARDELIAFACERMRSIAHRMLGRFPAVRRWDQTDDVVQNAALRLYRTLGQLNPRDARGFMGLMAVHIRRELLDLARKYAGPESYAANHETNVQRADGQEKHKIDSAVDHAESMEALERWSRLHLVVADMPTEEQEVFQMCWYLGLKQEEIAKLLDCSVRTVKRRWEAAKARLVAEVPTEKP